MYAVQKDVWHLTEPNKTIKDSKLSNLAESSLNSSKYSATAIWRCAHARSNLAELSDLSQLQLG